MLHRSEFSALRLTSQLKFKSQLKMRLHKGKKNTLPLTMSPVVTNCIKLYSEDYGV